MFLVSSALVRFSYGFPEAEKSMAELHVQEPHELFFYHACLFSIAHMIYAHNLQDKDIYMYVHLKTDHPGWDSNRVLGSYIYMYRAKYNSFDLICQMTGQQSVWTDIDRK